MVSLTRLSEADLRTALLHGEIQPFYQPLVNLSSGATAGFEILARWKHPAGGITSPADFIPVAESSGLICELTRQLLQKAFHTAAQIPADFGLSVNIAPVQLQDRSLPSTIRALAESFKFALSRLTVEITETALLKNQEIVRRTAAELKAMGIKLALDDFGTGYSNLKHLQALDFDELKVDRSFVRTITTERESRKIVSAVIGLGRSLGMRTVAEGVEDQSQADMLLCLGCDVGQGWLYGKAAPAKILERRSPPRLRPAYGKAEAYSNPILCLEASPTQGHAQLQAIYDGAPVGLCFLDCNMRYVNLNRRLAEMNGVPVQAHLGHTVAEMAPGVYAQAGSHMRQALAGVPVQGFEFTVPASSPSAPPRTLLASYQPARDEGDDVIGISVMVFDISDRKRAEEALRESEDHYRHMVELNPGIPWSTDGTGNNIEISSRWEGLTGQTAAESHGQGWLLVVHPEDRLYVEAAWVNALRDGHGFDVEHRIGTQGGGWHWVRSRAAPRRNAGGELMRWYGSTERIDDRKRHEQELEASAARLQAVIDVIPIGIVIAEAPSGRIISRNPATRTILHQDPIEFDKMDDYARRVQYFRGERLLQAHEFPLAQALLYGRTTAAEEVLYRSAEGLEKRVRLSSAPLKDGSGKIIGAVAAIQELESELEGNATDPKLASSRQNVHPF